MSTLKQTRQAAWIRRHPVEVKPGGIPVEVLDFKPPQPKKHQDLRKFIGYVRIVHAPGSDEVCRHQITVGLLKVIWEPGRRDRCDPDDQAALRIAAPQGEVRHADHVHRSRHGNGDGHLNADAGVFYLRNSALACTRSLSVRVPFETVAYYRISVKFTARVLASSSSLSTSPHRDSRWIAK